MLESINAMICMENYESLQIIIIELQFVSQASR